MDILFMTVFPFLLFLLIPVVSSLNILIKFKEKKDLFFSFYLFTFFLLLCQLINLVYTYKTQLFFPDLFRLVFLSSFLFLNISFYFIHKPLKFKLVDYLLFTNLIVITFLPNMVSLFGFEAEVFVQQYHNLISINVFLIYFHYLVMSLKGEIKYGTLLNSRFILKIILYTYHSILFSSVFLLFNFGFFVTISVSIYIIATFIISSFLFLIDLFIKYFSIDSNNKTQISSSDLVDGYSKSHLSNVDLEKLERDLESVMNKDKIFKDTMLTLKTLSSCVDVSSHQLSEYLNNNKNVSFSQYLMTFRVEEAKVLLVKYDWRTTMSIGYEVGFNSHSSFGRCFKLVTGESPGAFRSKLDK